MDLAVVPVVVQAVEVLPAVDLAVVPMVAQAVEVLPAVILTVIPGRVVIQVTAHWQAQTGLTIC